MRVAAQNGQPEIFYTLQGEGNMQGKPATFLRLSGCNLECVWCDTPYTWNWLDTKFDHPEKYDRFSQQINMSVEDLIEYWDYNPPQDEDILVITGGEPMLQQKDIIRLLEHKNFPFLIAEIETNGTIKPDEYFRQLPAKFNVSPKLANSKMPKEKRIKLDTLEDYLSYEFTTLKFVVGNQEDLTEVNDLVALLQPHKDKVLLMPEGRNQKDIQSKLAWLAQACMDNKYRLTNRLHVQTWGNTRGV